MEFFECLIVSPWLHVPFITHLHCSSVCLFLSFFLVNTGKLSSIPSSSMVRKLQEPMRPLFFPSNPALLLRPSILYVMRVLCSCRNKKVRARKIHAIGEVEWRTNV